MKKMLICEKVEKLFYFQGEEKVFGLNPALRGDCSGLIGNLSSYEISLAERKKGLNVNELVENDD